MTLYIVIVLDPIEGAYVWSDNTCAGEAGCSASDANHETGYKTIIREVEI